MLAAATAAWLALLLRAVTGFGGMTAVPLPVDDASVKQTGLGWRVPIPKEWRGAITVARGEVTEDGKTLHRRNGGRDVETNGAGRCAVSQGTVVLAASDDSDPRTNGRRYALVTAQPVPLIVLWGSFAALAALWVWLGHLWRPGADSRPGLGWFGLLFAGAAMLRAGVAWELRDASDPFMMVKGVPYSDCMGWLETARHLMEGRGLVGEFAGQRPLYPFLLGLFSLPGWGYLWASRVLNVLAGAAAAGVFGMLVTRASTSRPAGAAAALAVAIGGAQAGLVGLPMSETAAVAGAIIGLALLWRGSLRDRLPDLFLGGITHGIACLICPFTLLAVPPSGVVAAFGPGGWRRFLLRGATVAAGLTIVLLPWIIRQKVVWGVGSISLNSSLMLYAPLSPGGRYSPELETEALAAGLPPGDMKARALFYGRRHAEEVRRDPARYARIVSEGATGFLRRFEPDAMDVRLLLTTAALLIALNGIRRTGPGWRSATTVLLPAAAWASTMLPAVPWLALAAGGALAAPGHGRRRLAALLVCMVLGAATMDGLTSGALSRRLWSGADWAAVTLGLLAVEGLARRLQPRAAEPPADEVSAVPGLGAVAVGFSAAAVLATAAVGIATLRGAQPTLDAAPLTDAARATFLDTLRRKQPALATPLADPAAHWCGLVFIGDYRAALAAGEASGHWSRAFARRPEARTVVFARGADGEALTLQIPGDATRWTDGVYLIAGLWNDDPAAPLGHETRMLEVLAASPWRGDSADSTLLLEPADNPAPPPPASPSP